MVKKAAKNKQLEKKEHTEKKSKLSYEIAGEYYRDITKVKSKARAILYLKKDGEKLDGDDQAFLKELLKFHDKHDEKMKDFDGFVCGTHPTFVKTRCFFILRKNGDKEDFSVTKCI